MWWFGHPFLGNAYEMKWIGLDPRRRCEQYSLSGCSSRCFCFVQFCFCRRAAAFVLWQCVQGVIVLHSSSSRRYIINVCLDTAFLAPMPSKNFLRRLCVHPLLLNVRFNSVVRPLGLWTGAIIKLIVFIFIAYSCKCY